MPDFHPVPCGALTVIGVSNLPKGKEGGGKVPDNNQPRPVDYPMAERSLEKLALYNRYVDVLIDAEPESNQFVREGFKELRKDK